MDRLIKNSVVPSTGEHLCAVDKKTSSVGSPVSQWRVESPRRHGVGLGYYLGQRRLFRSPLGWL